MNRNIDVKRCAEDGVCEVDCIDGHAVASARAGLPGEEKISDLASCLRILANPARLRLLLALSQEELCVCDCSQLLGQSLSAASQHLKELRRLNLVQIRQDGKLAYYRMVEHAWNDALLRLADESFATTNTVGVA